MQLAARARLASTDGAEAMATLSGLLRRPTRRNAQAPQLGETITGTDQGVQLIMAALRTASAHAGAAEERGAVAAAHRQLEQEARDAASHQLRRSEALLPQAMASMLAGIACVGPQLLPGIALPPLVPSAPLPAPADPA